MDRIILFGARNCPLTASFTRTIQGASVLKLVKIDIYKRPEDALKYGVRAIPTAVLMKGGKEVSRVIGDLTMAQTYEWLGKKL